MQRKLHRYTSTRQAHWITLFWLVLMSKHGGILADRRRNIEATNLSWLEQMMTHNGGQKELYLQNDIISRPMNTWRSKTYISNSRKTDSILLASNRIGTIQKNRRSQWLSQLSQKSRRGSISIAIEGVKEKRKRIIEPTNATSSITPVSENQTYPMNETTIAGNSSSSLSLFWKNRRKVLSEIIYSPPPIPEEKDTPKVEVSFSVDPSSILILTQNLFRASICSLAAMGGTLRLLAPMIVARRFLSTIGYMWYDYYNGRYIRTTYNRKLKDFHELEVPAAFRALGRIGCQLASMTIIASFVRRILQLAPCFMPQVACRYWFGCIWVGSIFLARSSTMYWMKRYPSLELTPIASTVSQGQVVNTRPWHLLQWMKDPETWLLNLTRIQRHPSKIRRNKKPFRPDPLIFPSTWPPLLILSAVAMVHAIAQTLPIKTGANTRILMQDFCFALTLLDEWNRVFLHEHRIILGLILSATSFAAFFVLSVSAALEVGWISCALLLPIVFACLVSGWTNIVLYNEHYVQKW